MNRAAVVVAGILALAVASPVAGQTSKTSKSPANDPMKIAAAAGTYIGMMERCKADTLEIRAHYRARINSAVGAAAGDPATALALFEGSIKRSALEAAKRHVAGACEKTRAAPWTEFQKVIDGLLDGKWRF